jgi:hypothetical protein
MISPIFGTTVIASWRAALSTAIQRLETENSRYAIVASITLALGIRGSLIP